MYAAPIEVYTGDFRAVTFRANYTDLRATEAERILTSQIESGLTQQPQIELNNSEWGLTVAMVLRPGEAILIGGDPYSGYGVKTFNRKEFDEKWSSLSNQPMAVSRVFSLLWDNDSEPDNFHRALKAAKRAAAWIFPEDRHDGEALYSMPSEISGPWYEGNLAKRTLHPGLSVPAGSVVFLERFKLGFEQAQLDSYKRETKERTLTQTGFLKIAGKDLYLAYAVEATGRRDLNNSYSVIKIPVRSFEEIWTSRSEPTARGRLKGLFSDAEENSISFESMSAMKDFIEWEETYPRALFNYPYLDLAQR
jgi:hypothetical protein